MTIRKKRNSQNSLLAIVAENQMAFMWCAGLTGFQLFIIILAAFGKGESTTQYSIMYRSVFIIAALLPIGIVVARGRSPFGFWAMFCLIGFWSLYTLRFIVAGLVNREVDWIDFGLKVYGAAFVPMMAFLFVPRMRTIVFSFKMLYGVTFIAGILCLFVYRSFLSVSFRSLKYSSEIDQGMLVGPHLVSYVGGLLACLSIWSLFLKLYFPGRLFRASLLTSSSIGVFLMVFGASRGALLAAVGSVLFMLVCLKGVPLKRFLGHFLTILVAGSIAALYSSGQGDFSFWARMDTLLFQVDGSLSEVGGGRGEIWKNSIFQFIDNILFGDGLVESKSQNFPHNSIIESFMTTGVIGGGCFLALIIMGLRSSVSLLKSKSPSSWISLIYLFYLIQGQVSNPIYRYEFWFCLMAVLSYDYNYGNHHFRQKKPRVNLSFIGSEKERIRGEGKQESRGDGE